MSAALAHSIAAADYVGTLYAVRLRSGRELDVPEVELGIIEGEGFVTAPTLHALDAGRYLAPSDRGPWLRLSAVLYRADRPEYDDARGPADTWVHDVENTEVQLTRAGPVFRHPRPSALPRICPFPPGNFICEG